MTVEAGTQLDQSSFFLQQRLQRPTPQLTGVWVDGALTTNPSSGDVIADTTDLTAGEYVFAFIFTAFTAATSLRIEHRNAANDATNAAHTFPIQTNSVLEPIFPTKITVLEGERFRIVMAASLTGDVEASILYARLVG
jgi:hypothetical protein